MARSIHRLTDIAVKAANKAGRLSDGGNLYLRISSTGSKSWSFMWKVDKKPRELGIGSYPTVSLAGARKIAARYREIVSEGGDPRTHRDKKAEPVFKDAVEMFLTTMEGQWSNSKHRAQWRMTLTDFCTAISDKRVSQMAYLKF